jgi:hypothetical protein
VVMFASPLLIAIFGWDIEKYTLIASVVTSHLITIIHSARRLDDKLAARPTPMPEVMVS